MSALDELKKIDLEIITPLQAAVVYLSGEYEGDAAIAAAELAQLQADNAAKDASLQDILDLLRTGSAPDAFSMTPEQWAQHKIKALI